MTTVLVASTSRLQELEAVVERGMQTFIEVGVALAEIRDARLYVQTHSTFESYCKDRWKFTASRARQLIAAANTATALQSVTRVTVPTERHARELAQIIEHDGIDAAGHLLENLTITGAPTVADIRAAVASERDQAESSKQPITEKSTTETIEVPYDDWKSLQKTIWKLEKLCSASTKALAEVRKAKAAKAPRWEIYKAAKSVKVPAPVLDAVAELLAAEQRVRWHSS